MADIHGSAKVLAALKMATSGRVVSLDAGRFPGMPMWSGHPPFQVLTYRSPHGIRIQHDQGWLEPDVNEANIGIMSEVVIGTCHSGTHINSLSHITCGPDDHVYGGESAADVLGDFGVLRGGASEIPPLICRGVLVDLPRHLGVEQLAPGRAITADDLKSCLDECGIDVLPGDVVLFRTGQMAGWPDRRRMDASKGAGVEISAAKYLTERGVVAVEQTLSLVK